MHDFLQDRRDEQNAQFGRAAGLTLRGRDIASHGDLLAPPEARSGIGFAIPSALARAAMIEQLQKNEVERGLARRPHPARHRRDRESLGLDKAKGALVNDVDANSRRTRPSGRRATSC